MLSKLVLPFTLLLAPSVVSAAGQLGFCLGNKNPDGSCKKTSDYLADFDAISAASGSNIVRGYAASDCNFTAEVLPAAKEKNFKIVFGIWADYEESFNADLLALTQWVPQFQDQTYAVTVGSETMYRGDLPVNDLLTRIRHVKSALSSTKVGTADSWNKFADGTADPIIQGGVDILLVNAFGYWQAQDIENATHTYFDDIMQAFTHIQTVSGGSDIELWNGETGWPTDGGSDYGAAKASTANAEIYFSKSICGILKWGVNVFYFEAFDEPWKPAAIGDSGSSGDETHWGAMTPERTSKFALKC